MGESWSPDGSEQRKHQGTRVRAQGARVCQYRSFIPLEELQRTLAGRADGAVLHLQETPLPLKGWSSWLHHKHRPQPSLPSLAWLLGIPAVPTEPCPAGDKQQSQSSSPGVQEMPYGPAVPHELGCWPKWKMLAPHLQMPQRICNQHVENLCFLFKLNASKCTCNCSHCSSLCSLVHMHKLPCCCWCVSMKQSSSMQTESFFTCI